MRALAPALTVSAALSLLALAGCKQAAEPQPAPSSQAGEPSLGLAVSGGRMVLPAVKGNPAAAYFELANSTDKAVTVSAVSIDGVGKAEMHDMADGKMVGVPTLEVPAAGKVSFAPGGKHVMAFDLTDKLAPQGTAEMTLTLSNGDKISAPLKLEAMGAAMHEGMKH